MRADKPSRFEVFLSLAWYEIFLRFIANFVAKSAELLLAAGLVVSSANFLTDGDVLGMGSVASEAWSWTQALAIDASLGLSFYYVLLCLKQRDWVKFVLYSLLTLVLTGVAGIITDGDIFSHAIHAPIHDAMEMLGIDVRLLSILRSIAVVGFVLMSRLRDVSFKDLAAPEPITADHESPTTSATTQQVQVPQQMDPSTEREDAQFSLEDVVRLLQVVARSSGTVITEIPTGSDPLSQIQHCPAPTELLDQQKRLTLSEEGAHASHESQTGTVRHLAQSNVEVMVPDSSTKGPQSQLAMEPAPPQVEQSQPPHAPGQPKEPLLHPTVEQASSLSVTEIEPQDRDERLERAYQELLAEGQKISGRTLAERAHVHRSTCVSWLRARQPYQRVISDQPHLDGSASKGNDHQQQPEQGSIQRAHEPEVLEP